MLQVHESVVEEIAASSPVAREIVARMFPQYKWGTATLGDIVVYGRSYYLVSAHEGGEALTLVNVDDSEQLAGCFSSAINSQIHSATKARIIFKSGCNAKVVGKFQEIFKRRGAQNG